MKRNDKESSRIMSVRDTRKNHILSKTILLSHPLGSASGRKVHRPSQCRKVSRSEIIWGHWMGYKEAQWGTTQAKEKHFVRLISLSSWASSWPQFTLSSFVWLSEMQKENKNGEYANCVSVIFSLVLGLNLTVIHTITTCVTVSTEKSKMRHFFQMCVSILNEKRFYIFLDLNSSP